MRFASYYAMLGVDPDEKPAALRAAYTDLARYRPLQRRGFGEAFETLSDPMRRRQYDQRLESIPPEPMIAPGPEPEPVSILNRPENIRPSLEALRERLERNFTGRGVPKAEHAEPLTIEVRRSEEQAGGTTVLVGVPVLRICPVCHGSGFTFPYPCAECETRGFIRVVRTVRVHFGEGAPAGSVIERSLEDLGVENLYLSVAWPGR